MKKQWIAAGILLLAGFNGAQSQTYPSRTVTVIVPFAAGGPADVTGRIVADIFSRHLGQQFVVENVAGAGGTLGSLRAARATPDGYTIISGHMDGFFPRTNRLYQIPRGSSPSRSSRPLRPPRPYNRL